MRCSHVASGIGVVGRVFRVGALRRVFLAGGLVLALMGGLLNGAPAFAESGRGHGLPEPVASQPLPPGKVSGQQPKGPLPPAQRPLPASGAQHDAIERTRAKVARRTAPKPVPGHLERPRARASTESTPSRLECTVLRTEILASLTDSPR